MSLFEKTKRLNPELLGNSHDPKDPRMGEVVKYHPEDLNSAEVVILGCPEDKGVIRNKGRPGARRGPTEIRRAFYKLAPDDHIRSQNIFDIGDVVLGKTLEETHETLRSIVRSLLEQGKLILVLGGGNDISYPDCAALTDVKKDVLVFNIDKHFDVRDISPRNSGTAYRQLLEQGLIDPGKFYEMGFETFANSPVYEKYLKRKGVNIFSLDEMRTKGIAFFFEEILRTNEYDAVFWGIDMDVMRDADAPGVSSSYPTGLTAQEIMTIMEIAGRYTSFGVVEFTEVNPDVDIDNRTSKLTAILIYTFLSSRELDKDEVHSLA